MKWLRFATILLFVVLVLTSCLGIPGQPFADSHEPTAEPDLPDAQGPATEPELPSGATTPAGVQDTGSTSNIDSPNQAQIPSRLLTAGIQSAVRTPVATTISTRMVFEDVWFAIHANQITPPPVPAIDFASETVVLLILGERPSAGYSVHASSARMGETAALITVSVRSPEPGRMNAAVLTSPFEISAIAVTGVPVSFVGDDVGDGFDIE
jgi:protease stability complex PrcB-like protein